MKRDAYYKRIPSTSKVFHVQLVKWENFSTNRKFMHIFSVSFRSIRAASGQHKHPLMPLLRFKFHILPHASHTWCPSLSPSGHPRTPTSTPYSPQLAANLLGPIRILYKYVLYAHMYKIQEIVCIVFPYFISKFFTLEEERQLFNAHISILNLCQSHLPVHVEHLDYGILIIYLFLDLLGCMNRMNIYKYNL